MSGRLTVLVLVFALAGAAVGLRLWAAPADRGETVLLVDGTKLRGRLVALDEEGMTIETAEGKREVARGDLICVAFADWVELNAFGVRDNDYINYEHGFRFRLPPRPWHVEYRNPQLGVEGALLEAYDSNRALYLVVASERLALNLEQAKAALVSVQQQNVPGFRLVEETRVQASGQPAYKLVFTANVGGMDFQYQMVIVVNQGIIFRILAWTMGENYDALEEAMEPLVEGFQLLK